MKAKFYVVFFALVFSVTGVALAPAYESMVGPTGVLLYDAENSYGGYTLFSPMVNRRVSVAKVFTPMSSNIKTDKTIIFFII